MSSPITHKNMGTDEETGLDMAAQAFRIVIDTDLQEVRVFYRDVLLAPKNREVVKIIEEKNYRRYNRPAIKGNEGSTDEYIIKEANLKFDQLRFSEIGLMLAQMINLDMMKYDGSTDSLKQD